MEAESKWDERTAAYLSHIAQRMSRRSVLTTVGKWSLRLVGLSLVRVALPVDRAFAQFACTSDWQTCNMHGYFCTSCCGHGPRYSQCPSCSGVVESTTSWTGCCYNPNDCTNVLIRYKDCCGGGSEAAACKGAGCGWTGSCPPGAGPCPPDGDWPAYCSSGQEFRCTIVFNTGSTCTR
jgi:methylamine dehydrogenase light chain